MSERDITKKPPDETLNTNEIDPLLTQAIKRQQGTRDTYSVSIAQEELAKREEYDEVTEIEAKIKPTIEPVKKFLSYIPSELSKHAHAEEVFVFGNFKEFKKADFGDVDAKKITDKVRDALISAGFPDELLLAQCAIGYCEIEVFNPDNIRYGIDISHEKFIENANIFVPWERYGVFYDDYNESTIFYDAQYPEMSICPTCLTGFILKNDTDVNWDSSRGRLISSLLWKDVYDSTKSFHFYFPYIFTEN